MIKRIAALLLGLAGVHFSSNAQSISRINLKVTNDSAIITSVELRTDNFLIKISQNGNGSQRMHWDDIDNEHKKADLNYLDNTAIEYYTQYDGFDNIGKLKSIGKVKITYFDRFDNPDKTGKIKSIGNIGFAYYDKFDNIGKLKSVGDINIFYQDRFDGQDNIGKLKMIGNTNIIYYTRFDGKENLGKIKQIEGNTPSLNIVRVGDEF
jgi:hypothetical protein